MTAPAGNAPAERARIVAALRVRAAAHRAAGRTWRDAWAAYSWREGTACALEAMAERIERGGAA